MDEVKLESIVDLAEVLTYQNDFQEILRLVSRKASEMLNAHTTLVMMINPLTHSTIRTLFRENNEAEGDTYSFLHTYLSGWVIDHDSGFVTEDISNDPRFRKGLLAGHHLKSIICVPLRVEGIITGTILVLNRKGGTVYDFDDLQFLEKFSAVVSPFLRNIQKIKDYFITQLPEDALINKYKASGLLGKSKSFLNLLRSLDAAANCDARVLLQGKSGTGKEMVARAIHNYSKRSNQKFIAIDCGAIPENLIESELFGHIKGAFTGAAGSRTGLFEEANHGTLFLDEISNLPLELQSKLLRVLQEGEIRPLGSNVTRKVDVRIISAASVSLKDSVNQQKFREDLFYRLMVYPIYIPLLMERREDIMLLANHFLQRFAKEQHKKAESFHEEIIDFMKNHEWTGNIRELENFIERIITLAPVNRKQIDKSMLPHEFQIELKSINRSRKKLDSKRSLDEILSDQEKEILQKSLKDNHWNQSMAARELGIHESTLRYKISKYNIKKEMF
jgi:transcriptional regulator with GAF, ATPase, and Fis domain